MNIEKLQENLRRTIANKEAMLGSHNAFLKSSGMYDKSFYQVFKCNSTWMFDYDSSKVLFESDNLGKAHSFAYEKHLEDKQVYTIIQPYDGSCRGGYGFPDEPEKKEQKMNIYQVRDNMINTIRNKESFLAIQRENLAIYESRNDHSDGWLAAGVMVQFLEININELKRILEDIELCVPDENGLTKYRTAQ